VSFVSVTQQFNTTTSMGRLTLNVLLSFAQFEREVTSERIRDKIAASKRKVGRRVASLKRLGQVHPLCVPEQLKPRRAKDGTTRRGLRQHHLSGVHCSSGCRYDRGTSFVLNLRWAIQRLWQRPRAGDERRHMLRPNRMMRPRSYSVRTIPICKCLAHG